MTFTAPFSCTRACPWSLPARWLPIEISCSLALVMDSCMNLRLSDASAYPASAAGPAMGQRRFQIDPVAIQPLAVLYEGGLVEGLLTFCQQGHCLFDCHIRASTIAATAMTLAVTVAPTSILVRRRHLASTVLSAALVFCSCSRFIRSLACSRAV